MKQIGWLALQATIIGGCIWVEYMMEQEGTPLGGNGAFIGFFLAFVVTLALVTIMNWCSFLFGWIRAAVARTSRPRTLPPHIGQSEGEDRQLTFRRTSHALQNAP
jgi:hypothetical protein